MTLRRQRAEKFLARKNMAPIERPGPVPSDVVSYGRRWPGAIDWCVAAVILLTISLAYN